MNPIPGDMIKFFRTGYKHHAIFITTDEAGPESIIHWWTEDNALEPRIQITPFQNLAAILNHEIVTETRPDHGNLVAQRAIAFKQCVDARRAEGNNYESLFHDDTHFVRWCYNGLGKIDITPENIRNVRDPWRFVHGSVTNTLASPYIKRDNENLLQNLQPGEIIRFFHQHYEHWAVYLAEEGGVHNVIHWWDRDSVGLPSIVVDDLETVAGYCRAEIDSYRVLVDGNHAVHLAQQFIDIALLVPNDMFDGSKQFAFWCRFGLGLSDLQHIPDMATEEHVRNFVNGIANLSTFGVSFSPQRLMARSDPDHITSEHNEVMERQLNLGDVITLSQGSRQYFAVCIDAEVQDGRRRVMRWLENGFPSVMVELFQTAAGNKKAMLYINRANLEIAINWEEMVNRANALRARIQNDEEEDYSGLFSSSKHFALWIFDKYGPNDAHVTVPEIERFDDIWRHIYGFMSSKKSRQNKIRIRRQNKRVLDACKEGDLVSFHRIKFRSITYEHYAVYIGKCENSGALSVIHWYPDPTDHTQTKPKASIRTDAFWTVAGYDVAENGNDVMKEHSAYDGDTVVQRAKQRRYQFENQTGQRRQYSLLSDNCEHFACECRYGVHSSRQVDRYMSLWPFEG